MTSYLNVYKDFFRLANKINLSVFRQRVTSDKKMCGYRFEEIITGEEWVHYVQEKIHNKDVYIINLSSKKKFIFIFFIYGKVYRLTNVKNFLWFLEIKGVKFVDFTNFFNNTFEKKLYTMILENFEVQRIILPSFLLLNNLLTIFCRLLS